MPHKGLEWKALAQSYSKAWPGRNGHGYSVCQEVRDSPFLGAGTLGRVDPRTPYKASQLYHTTSAKLSRLSAKFCNLGPHLNHLEECKTSWREGRKTSQDSGGLMGFCGILWGPITNYWNIGGETRIFPYSSPQSPPKIPQSWDVLGPFLQLA